MWLTEAVTVVILALQATLATVLFSPKAAAAAVVGMRRREGVAAVAAALAEHTTLLRPATHLAASEKRVRALTGAGGIISIKTQVSQLAAEAAVLAVREQMQPTSGAAAAEMEPI